MEKDILLAAIPMFVGAVVAHLWPSRKHLVIAIVSTAAIGICLGSLGAKSSVETWDVVARRCFIIVAAGAWTVVALLHRAKTTQQLHDTAVTFEKLRGELSAAQGAISKQLSDRSEGQDQDLRRVRQELMDLWTTQGRSLFDLTNLVSRISESVETARLETRKELVDLIMSLQKRIDALAETVESLKGLCLSYAKVMGGTEGEVIALTKRTDERFSDLEREARENFETVKMLYHDYAARRDAARLKGD